MEGKTKVVTFVFLSCLKPKWKQTDCVLLEDGVFTCFFFLSTSQTRPSKLLKDVLTSGQKKKNIIRAPMILRSWF